VAQFAVVGELGLSLMNTAFGNNIEKVFRQKNTSDARRDRELFHRHISESYEAQEDEVASDTAREQTADDISSD